jgi:hypothetical protein
MGVELAVDYPEYNGYSEELLEKKYVVTRDEMLWRAFSRCLTHGGRNGVNSANKILRVIREAPD